MGCHAGSPESLKPGDAANPRGYWERWDAWALDEQILAAAGANWWQVADLDLGSLTEDDRQRFEAHARDLVAELDEHRPWVLKDPRLCVLLPLWRPALSAPVFVLGYRDPLEVALSLRARDGLPLAAGIALWEIYNLAALRHSLGAPRLGVSYHCLLSDPQGVAAALAAGLEPFAPGALSLPAADELAEVVASDLHRQRARPQELDEYLNVSQSALFRALEDGTALEWESVPPPSAGALDALRSYAAAERERLDLSRRATEMAARCTEAEGLAAWRRDREVEHERWIASLQTALATAETERNELTARCAEVEGQAAWRRDREVEHERWIASLREALATAEDELGRLRQRDAEISRWNETLTARLAVAESETSRLAAAHLEEVAGLTAQLDELRLVLGRTVRHAEQTGLHAEELGRLTAEILRSQTWRLGRALTAPARWGRSAPLADSQYEKLRRAAESLASERQSLVAQAAGWIEEDEK
jgi:hypothetical protein